MVLGTGITAEGLLVCNASGGVGGGGGGGGSSHAMVKPYFSRFMGTYEEVGF